MGKKKKFDKAVEDPRNTGSAKYSTYICRERPNGKVNLISMEGKREKASNLETLTRVMFMSMFLQNQLSCCCFQNSCRSCPLYICGLIAIPDIYTYCLTSGLMQFTDALWALVLVFPHRIPLGHKAFLADSKTNYIRNI